MWNLVDYDWLKSKIISKFRITSSVNWPFITSGQDKNESKRKAPVCGPKVIADHTHSSSLSFFCFPSLRANPPHASPKVHPRRHHHHATFFLYLLSLSLFFLHPNIFTNIKKIRRVGDIFFFYIHAMGSDCTHMCGLSSSHVVQLRCIE